VSGFGAGLIAALGIKKIIDLNREFSKSLAEINTIAGDLGKTQKELRNQLIDTSAQFGTSARDQARSFYQIISAGITDATTANEVLIASNKLAVGGLTTIEGAVDLLTSAVNAFGKENLSAERASDILFATVKLGKTKVEELQSSMGLILPTASALGIEFEDVAAAIAQITLKGVSTAEAVTQLSAVFTAVLKKQETAKKLGPQVAAAFKLQALQAKGLTKFLKDLTIATGGSSEVLTKLLGRAEGTKAILSLASDGFEGLADKVLQLKNSAGAADAAFQIMANTLDTRLNRAGAIFSGIILKIGDDTGSLNNVLDELNEQLSDVLTGLTRFGGIDGLIGASVTNMLISFKRLQLQIGELLALPVIGSAFFESAQGGAGALKILRFEIAQLEQSIVNVGMSTADLFPEEDPQNNPLVRLQKDIVKTADVVKTQVDSISRAINSGLVKGISQAAQAMGAALSGAGEGFSNLHLVVLGIMGDMAIQIGTVLIGIGVGMTAIEASIVGLTGGPALFAGVALVALGGLLKSLSGGATAAPVGGGGVTAPGGGGAQIETPTPEELEDQGPKTEVTVIVQGNILDRRETGLELAEVLRETFQSNDIQVGFA